MITYIYIYIYIGIMVRVFANGPGDTGSIPGRVILKTQKMLLDAILLNTQHYKVRIEGKVEQSRDIYIYIYICVCVCVCMREREKRRERESFRQIVKQGKGLYIYIYISRIWTQGIVNFIFFL